MMYDYECKREKIYDFSKEFKENLQTFGTQTLISLIALGKDYNNGA